MVFPRPAFLFHSSGRTCRFWISSNLGLLECGSFATASQYFSQQLRNEQEQQRFSGFAGCGHVLGLRIRAFTMAGEFKLKIAKTVTLVTTAGAPSAFLGFLTSGFVFLGILALVPELSGSDGYTKGPSFAAPTAVSPRVVVEKAPQEAAALGFVDEPSQTTSRCLFQKHPAIFFCTEGGKGGREKKWERMVGFSFVGSMVRCDADCTVGKLFSSLHVRTFVPVDLFYLVVGA